MPRSSRSPRDPCDPPEDVAHPHRDPRPRRVTQRSRIPSRTEESSTNMNDAFLLPLRLTAPSPGLTQFTLGCICASCSSRSSWKRQVSWSSFFLVRPQGPAPSQVGCPWLSPILESEGVRALALSWRHCPSVSLSFPSV
uniref:Sad1 and UNC84 domain containing 5 n=1 Tax=Molossus molossus TaxID=27622 RepID=A0A7J8HKL1_MOLMO|nr:Sad1 and UNC84 domain containing 5 [Molossus molossus]